MNERRFVSLIIASLLAGCAGTSSPLSTDSPTDATDALPWEDVGALVYHESHDHVDRSLHTEVRRGVTVLNQSSLSDSGKSLGEYTEADAERGLIAVAVVTGIGSTMKILLLDEAALPALKLVGSFIEPNSYGDVKLDPAQPFAYIPYAMGAVPDGRAFSIWDVSEPARARRLGEAPGAGCHMLHPMRLGSTSYVWCAAIDGAQLYAITNTPNGAWTGVPLFAAEPQGDLEVVRYTTYYAALGPPRAWVTRVHDMTYQLDPLTNQPVLVTAHELQGIRVFDVSNPLVPRQVSGWRGQGTTEPIDRVHTVGLAKIGGKRIGIGATETFNKVPPAMYVVDFTDYAAPKLLAKWVPPGIRTDGGLTYSLHNFQVVGSRVYIANFHAGLWVLDLSDPAKPEPIALTTPVWDTEYPHPGQQDLPGFRLDQNMYWDPIVVNGYLIATDMSAGVEVLVVDGDPVGASDYDGFL